MGSNHFLVGVFLRGFSFWFSSQLVSMLTYALEPLFDRVFLFLPKLYAYLNSEMSVIVSSWNVTLRTGFYYLISYSSIAFSSIFALEETSVLPVFSRLPFLLSLIFLYFSYSSLNEGVDYLFLS
jgi:hypothetical protein